MPILFKNIYYKIIFIFLLFISPNEIYGQFFLYSEAPIDISTSFTRHSINAKAQQPIFNVLKIKNNSNRSESFTLNITVPQGWRIIGQDKIEITLAPFDSLFVPIRIGVGANVRGDIGYSVIASLSDTRGNTIKNEYCFVKIPREADLSIRIIDRLVYLDPISSDAKFSLKISNKGNRDEPVTFNFDGNRRLGIGENKNSLISYDYNIPPYTDSIFSFRIELKDTEIFGRNMFGLNASIITVDTTVRNTLWFRKLESTYKNIINPSDKPLSVEIIGQGLLDASRKPITSLFIEGRTLFKNDAELYYYYRNFSSYKKEDFYKSTRMHLGAKIGKWNLEIGDNYRSMESITLGRGGYVAYDNKKIKTEFLANKNFRSGIENYAGYFSYNLNLDTKLQSGLIYSKASINDFESKLAFLGSRFKILKIHNLYAMLGINQITREIDGVNFHNQFGGELNYSSTLGPVTTTIRTKYGSPLYYSSYAGRLNVFFNSVWLINPKNKISFYFTEDKSNQTVIQGTTITRNIEMVNRLGKVEHQRLISPSVFFFYGPAVEEYRWVGLSNFVISNLFRSVNYKLILGARFKNPSSTFTVSPKVEISQSQILNNPFVQTSNSAKRNQFGYQYFSLNYRDNSFNILAFYTSGPRSAFDQMNYANLNRSNRKFQLMPAFDRFVYKDIIRLYAGFSYTNDIVAKSSYSNITGQVYVYLPNSWRLYTLAVYSLQNRTNTQEVAETYQNLYVEASIRKEFDIQQPRVKFYDVNFVFFKDFNGNYIQEPNESGIKNVLVLLTKESSDVTGRIPGDFFSAELICDNLGRVFLEKIPEGRYSIVYNSIGLDAGNFSKAIEDVEIIINRSGDYFFPFVEKNKVFGKIILNRSRLSGLGKLDLANVRITATDSHGRSYTTLTDKNGEFVLFAPVTDEYIVNINNIYYENFDLRQNNFRVQFNGYKQFEVNYVFDEKVRRINFAAAPGGEVVGGVMQVRRTTLSGSVKDANTQNPVRARVNLINTKTNAVAVSTYSSATSGEYTLSFVAGDSYLIEVLADDYWYMSENLSLNQITTFMSINREVLLKPISVGSKVELNISFAPNSSDLSPEAVAEINRLVRQLRNNPTVRLQIQGHCDDLEALQKSGVALDRANAVIKLLIESGYSNVEARSLGNTVPLVANDTEDGRSRNRRVEVEVISK